MRIQYNDYRNQKAGQAAPKKYRDMPPLVAMDVFLQHQLPAYFHKVRHYGLHAGSTYKKYKNQIPGHLKRSGRTVRTIIQILRALLSVQPNKCEKCGGVDFEIAPVSIDRTYLFRNILHQGRSPPSGMANKVGP